jgi:hypothetical protein
MANKAHSQHPQPENARKHIEEIHIKPSMKTPGISNSLNLLSPWRAAPALVVACALVSGGHASAQPTITNIYPDGSVLFQWTNKLTFVTGGAATITNISVTFDAKPMAGAENIQIYTSATGLTINGNNVSAPLQSNVVYSATIIAWDATGLHHEHRPL